MFDNVYVNLPNKTMHEELLLPQHFYQKFWIHLSKKEKKRRGRKNVFHHSARSFQVKIIFKYISWFKTWLEPFCAWFACVGSLQ